MSGRKAYRAGLVRSLKVGSREATITISPHPSDAEPGAAFTLRLAWDPGPPQTAKETAEYERKRAAALADLEAAFGVHIRLPS